MVYRGLSVAVHTFILRKWLSKVNSTVQRWCPDSSTSQSPRSVVMPIALDYTHVLGKTAFKCRPLQGANLFETPPKKLLPVKVNSTCSAKGRKGMHWVFLVFEIKWAQQQKGLGGSIKVEIHGRIAGCLSKQSYRNHLWHSTSSWNIRGGNLRFLQPAGSQRKSCNL